MHSKVPLALWGRCAVCTRWYAIRTGVTERVRWQCPVCGGDPEAFENHADLVYAGQGRWSDAIMESCCDRR